MQYDVIITKKPDAPWHATIPARPGYVAEGPTREDALARLAAQFDAGTYTEVTRIEIPDAAPNNGAEPEPSGIMKYFGAFRDDPYLDELFDDIEKRRDEHLV